MIDWRGWTILVNISNSIKYFHNRIIPVNGYITIYYLINRNEAIYLDKELLIWEISVYDKDMNNHHVMRKRIRSQVDVMRNL